MHISINLLDHINHYQCDSEYIFVVSITCVLCNLFTPAKEVMSAPRPSVGWLVCWFAGLSSNRKNTFNFGTNPDKGLDPGGWTLATVSAVLGAVY